MLYPELDFLDRFAAAARDGFKAVEFLFPYAFESREIGARLEANGLRQVLFNAPPGDWDGGERGLACLPGREAEFRAGIARALDYAAVLECPRIHVMAGLLPAGVERAPLYPGYIENLRWAALQAASQGVDVLIEPINLRDMPGFFLNRQDHAHQVIEDVGGWDPFNVTEDADLGMRLHRKGFRTAILDSVTWEEANSDFINWIKQRSRWYKGYIQTWAVHLRHPVTLYRQLGLRAFLEFNLFVGGTPLLALLNPVFWGMTILWFVSEPSVLIRLLPGPIYYLSLICWLGGNFVLTYLSLMMAQDMVGKHKFHRAALLTPLYWIMMSIAAVKAAVQFVFQPSHWEKTVHGLTGKHETPGSDVSPQ